MNTYNLTNFWLMSSRRIMENTPYYTVNLTYTSNMRENEKMIQEREFDKLDEAIEFLKEKVDESHDNR